MIVSHPDCLPFTEGIAVKNDLAVNISLEHHVNDIEQVNLHAVAKKTGSVLIKTIDGKELAQNRYENLGNILADISGVGTLKTGNNIAKPIIHGMFGSRVSILSDGVKLAEQEWGVEHAPTVDVQGFEHIDVIKGASTLKYGSDAVGGVILLEPKIFPKKDTLMGNLALSGISNGRGADVGISIAKTWQNGWVIKSGGSFRKLGDLAAPGYGLMNTGLQNSGFNFSLMKKNFDRGFAFDYYLTSQSIGILRSSHISSPQDLAEALSMAAPIYQRAFGYAIDNPKQEIDHHIAKISAYQRGKDFGKITASYSFQYNHRKEYDIRRTEDLSKIPSMNLELITHDFTLTDLLETPKWNWETGISAQYQNNYSTTATEARRLIPNYDKYSAGIYSVFRYKVSPVWNMEAGARFDMSRFDVLKWYNLNEWNERFAKDYPQFVVRINQNRILTNPKLDYRNVSVNGGVEYHPSDKFNLKLNYSRIARTPNIAELFADGLHHSAATIEEGDLRIKSETGHQINLIADVKADVLAGLQISLNPYFFFTKNFINQVPDSYRNTQWGNFIVWKYQQIDAKMYGADADAELNITANVKYKANVSYLFGQDLSNNLPLILMVPFNISNSLEYKKAEWSNFFVGVSHRFVSHQNRFPVYNIDVQLFDQQGNPYFKTLDISTPPSSYQVWSARAGADLAKNLDASLSVRNIFNTGYRDYLNRLRYFSEEMGRNIVLTLNYKF